MPVLSPSRFRRTFYVSPTSSSSVSSSGGRGGGLIIYLAPSMILLLVAASGIVQEATSSPTTNTAAAGPIPNLGQGFLDLNRNPMAKQQKQHLSSASFQGQSGTPQQQQQQQQKHHHSLSASDAAAAVANRKHYFNPVQVKLGGGTGEEADNRHSRQLPVDHMNNVDRKRKRTTRRPPRSTAVVVTDHLPIVVTTPTTAATEGAPPMENKGGPGFAYCSQLCKEGMGGLACECDIVPIG